MRILIDANVVSEPLKPKPSADVVAWLRGLNENEAFPSVITFAEIRRGISSRVDGRRKTQLARWLDVDLRSRFAGRVIPVDEEVAKAWGDLMSASIRRGHNIGAMDCFIAATASVHRLSIATRNARDFKDFGLTLVDPWQA